MSEPSHPRSAAGRTVAARIHSELARASRGGLTRGELASLLIDIDDDEVSTVLDAELAADRVVSGVSGPAMLVRYYLSPDARGAERDDLTDVKVGSTWAKRSPGPGSPGVSGPAHVVVRIEQGVAYLLTSHGESAALPAVDVEQYFLRSDALDVARSLAVAERWADELEEQARALRRATAAFRNAVRDG